MTERHAKGLYDPAFERDSCGFGLIAIAEPKHKCDVLELDGLQCTQIGKRRLR